MASGMWMIPRELICASLPPPATRFPSHPPAEPRTAANAYQMKQNLIKTNASIHPGTAHVFRLADHDRVNILYKLDYRNNRHLN